MRKLDLFCFGNKKRGGLGWVDLGLFLFVHLVFGLSGFFFDELPVFHAVIDEGGYQRAGAEQD